MSDYGSAAWVPPLYFQWSFIFQPDVVVLMLTRVKCLI